MATSDLRIRFYGGIRKIALILSWALGALALTWAVAAGIALRDVVRNLGLVRAIAIAVGIMGVGNLYYTIVAEEPMATDWVFSAVFIVLFLVLAVLCP